jgi:hypothetical protein
MSMMVRLRGDADCFFLLLRAPCLRRALSCAAAAIALSSSGVASAYDSLAAPCEEDPLYCLRGPVAFERTDALPVEFNFDTGWVPGSSPLQVHLLAAVYANTQVSLAGALETSWPNALLLACPGSPDGGAFSYHYGLEVSAEGRVRITVLGRTYEWEGDIPYVPQVDVQVQSAETFDAWGWEPGLTMESSSPPQRLATVGLGDLLGASIPGMDGGFELDAGMDVAARYQTRRIVISTTEGEVVSGGELTKDKDRSSTAYLDGPSVELDVHPEGSVRYDGTLHLIPAFYIEFLGRRWSIPVVDIPLDFPIAENEWVFDEQRVHVPLPDLVIEEKEIDFGEVEVGQESVLPYSLFNAGEASLGVALESDDPESFEALEAELVVDAAVTLDSGIRFTPTRSGELTATLLVSSNDPSDPVQRIVLKGTGYDVSNGSPDSGGTVAEDSSCACRAAGAARREAGAGGVGAAWAAGVALAALSGRRRRRSA